MGFLDFLKKKDAPVQGAAPRQPSSAELDAIGKKIADEIAPAPPPRQPRENPFFEPESDSRPFVQMPHEDFLEEASLDLTPSQPQEPEESAQPHPDIDWTQPLEEMGEPTPLEEHQQFMPPPPVVSAPLPPPVPVTLAPPPPPKAMPPVLEQPAPPPLPPMPEKKAPEKKLNLPDFTDDDIANAMPVAPTKSVAPVREEQIARHTQPATPAQAFLVDPQGSDAIPPPPSQPEALRSLAPAMFLSSDAYFAITDDIKTVRKSLRESDTSLRNLQSQHVHTDEQLAKFAAEINAIEEKCMALDAALFEG